MLFVRVIMMMSGGLEMLFIHPRVRPLFERLSPEVQRKILKKNCKIYTEMDLETAVSGNACSHVCHENRHD